MGREEEGFITADFELDRLMEDRLSWGLFRDRRPEMYGKNKFRNLNNQRSSQSLQNEKECSTIKRYERMA